MGNTSSKAANGAPSHSWASSGAVPKPDHDLVKSLQSSTETDASRAQALELAVQARVEEELKKLQEKEGSSFRQALDQISAEASSSSSPPESGDNVESKLSGPSRFTVSKEVQALRAKLEERRNVQKIPETVMEARGEVVRCLRENDRRPLDCWEEVQRFKEEVKKMEMGWVDKVVS